MSEAIHSADGKNWYNHAGEKIFQEMVDKGEIFVSDKPIEMMHEDGKPCDCDLNGQVQMIVPCAQEACQEFMEAAGQLSEVGWPESPDDPIRQTRRRMMFGKQGEANECYFADVRDNDLVETIDGLCDMIWIAWGSLFKFLGPEIAAEVMIEINRSNLDKINGKHGPIVWDGEPGKSKVKKPEGWRPPDVAGILRRHGLTPK